MLVLQKVQSERRLARRADATATII